MAQSDVAEALVNKRKAGGRERGRPTNPPQDPPSLPLQPAGGDKAPRLTRVSRHPPQDPAPTNGPSASSAAAAAAPRPIPPGGAQKEMRAASTTAGGSGGGPSHPHGHQHHRRGGSGSKLSRSEVSMDEEDDMDLNSPIRPQVAGANARVVKARLPPAVVLRTLQVDQQEMLEKDAAGANGWKVPLGKDGRPREGEEGRRPPPPPPSDVHESSAEGKGGKKALTSSSMPPPPPPPPPVFHDVVLASPGASAPPPPPFFAAVAGRIGQGQGQAIQRPLEPSSSAVEASRMSVQPEQARLEELIGMLTAGDDDDENQVVESSQVTAR